MQKQIAMAFPTPVGQFRVPDPGPTNQALARLILDKETADPAGDVYSNAGGWHSKADLLSWPDPAVVTLRGWISEAVNHMVAASAELMRAALGGRPLAPARLHLAAWANVCRSGHYHRVHNHPGGCWSGVYYVQAGTDAPGRPLSGVLELLDPRPFTEMVTTPANPFGQKAIVRPEPGLMVLFPSWLYHCVNPYFGEGERISVSFNVRAEEAPR
jgi:uncharacterized protein (TIGR02466 family)